VATIGAFLNGQPLLALFLVIGLGYAVGRISIAGFSLGIGAILFVGLAVGAIAPKSTPPGLVGLLGLVLFLYGIGIQYGKDFFQGLASPLGIKANILAAVAVIAGCAAAVGAARAMGFGLDFAAGMFAGSMTSSASLQAALDAAGGRNPATGYAIAYPFGVFGPILCFFLANKLFRPKIPVPSPNRLVVAETRVGDRGLVGTSIAELLKGAPEGVEILGIRRGGMNVLPEPTLILEADDILAVAGLADAVARLKLDTTEAVRSDRRHLDYVRVYVSKPAYVGMTLSTLPMPANVRAQIMQVRRGDVDLLPRADLVIQYGDQLGIIVEAARRDDIARFFGDSIKAEGDLSFISLGLGVAAGALIGLIPIPIPGLGSVKLGIAGGPLVVSLILGYFGRLGPFNFYLPLVANVLMRNFGLTVFLAAVGMSSGAPFVANVTGPGLGLLLAGVIVLLTVVVTVLLVGYYVLRMSFDDVLGIAAGATGNPAILAYANTLAPTGRPDIGYAMIFPGVGTILKVIAVQAMVTLWAVPPGDRPAHRTSATQTAEVRASIPSKVASTEGAEQASLERRAPSGQSSCSALCRGLNGF
jgi:putative transport protein